VRQRQALAAAAAEQRCSCWDLATLLLLLLLRVLLPTGSLKLPAAHLQELTANPVQQQQSKEVQG
jgi:hypothetical protein